MANYLNKPISSGFRNTYTSQFVPLPLELFARANERDQKTQDDYVAQTKSTSDGIWKINPIDANDKQYTDQFKQGFDDAASQLVNTNLTQRENQDKVKKLIKDTSRDKDLNHIMTVSAQYQTAQETRSKMMADNTYNRFNDIAADSYEDYVKSGGYKSGKGLSTDIIKYEDTRPARERVVDDMKANGNDIVAQFGDTFYKNGYEGISKSQAYITAKSSLSEYMQTNAGTQDAREFRMMKRNNPKNKDLQKMDEGDYIFSKILTAANERVFNKTSSGLAEAKNADAKAKKEKEAEFSFGNVQTVGSPTVATAGFNFDFNADGSAQGSGQSFVDHFKKTGWSFNTIRNYMDDKSSNLSNPKDMVALGLNTAAKMNGIRTDKLVETLAGPDVKLSTTYHALPAKQQVNADKQFYDMQRETGLFNTMPVFNLTTGERGSMVEILRLAAERGEFQNDKGETLSLSKNPTSGEVQNLLKAAKLKVAGKQDPNYLGPKNYVIKSGTVELSIDPTYGGTRNIDYNNKEEVAAVRKSKSDNISVSGGIFEPDSKTGEQIFHWKQQVTKTINGVKYEAGHTYSEPLSKLKD